MRDPKAIRKAIMTAKSIASLVDPKFARVPLPDLGVPAPEVYVPEHSPAMHEAFGVPMPKGYAAGGDVDDGEHEITAYHGSANEFPEFSMSARGRGSGQAAFGEGHNFAEDEDVARRYRNLTARDQGLADVIHPYTGEVVPYDAPEAKLFRDAVRHGDRDLSHAAKHKWPQMIDVLHKRIADFERSRAELNDDDWVNSEIADMQDSIAAHERAIELAKTHRLEPKGHMYEVGLRLNPDKLLKWHEPLEEQPEALQRYLVEKGIAHSPDWRGSDVYRALTAHPDNEPEYSPKNKYSGEIANQILADLGLHGIKWKDTDSRIAPGRGGHNYTVWDDSRIKVRRRYAAGGSPEDENSYAQPDDLGLYSHAAVAASNLPKTGTPQQMKEILLRQPGVKPSELHWGEYDYAFGDKPEVSRDEIAKQMWMNIPSIEEKVLRERKPGELSASEYLVKHHKERQSIWDEDLSPAELNQRRREMNQRHAAERASAWHHNPYHEYYTLPGGENYREILLKHGSGGMFKGVDVHFGGEPDVVTSMMVKDRKDTEGDKVFHIEELQSDWAQQGRKKGFSGEPSDEAEKRLTDFLASLGQRTGMDVTSMWPHVAMEAANALGERDMLHQLAEEREAERKRNKSIIKPAPYVTKTEDWVDLGLKRALREAAEKGYDKLAWSPGHVIANRYNLADHVGQISHEKNEDGTYNLFVKDKKGRAIFDKEDMTPEEVSDYLGKGVSEQIFAGEGETGKEAHEQYDAAKNAYDDFLNRASLAYADSEMQGVDIPEDRQEQMRNVLSRVAREGLSGHRNRDRLLADLGLGEEEAKLRSALEEAAVARNLAPAYSPFRDWRHLKPENLQIGEKWPFEMYDRMIHKRALRLAKMHDPEAKLEKSVVSHSPVENFDEWEPEEEGNVSSNAWQKKPAQRSELHAIRITPKMRESILKKGFPAYAQGGEVEGYADGGAPNNPYAQNPNGGLMFPPEEGAARLEAMQRRNALVSSGNRPDAGLPKNPRVVIPAPEDSELPDFVTGNITFDDWRKRHEKILSDDEIHHSSKWYKNIYGNFLKYYPDPQEAKKMMRAWLVAQQNVSPAGAMNNVLMQQEQMDRGEPEHLWRAGGMPNPTAAARAVLGGQPIAGGVGQKIADFVDSAEGKNTRSWMGDHPHGGDPFVVDVHTARDTGMIDQELINHLKRAGYDPEQLDKLQIDLKGSPTEAAYENRAQFGRDLTAYLNKMNWKGRNDWTPAEVQAVGWMGMTKLTRNAEEDSESGLGRNLRRISYELSPGEGSPWADKYGEAFESLPDEDRYAITQKMADSAMEHAQKLSGINVHSLVHGTGAWENYQNPSAVAQSLSTQRAADIAAAALGHMLQQTEVWHNRVKPIGASPKGFALDFIERGSKNLADPAVLRDFWQKVMDADPHGIVKGYQPITLPSGEVGLRALFDKGGAKALNAVQDLFAKHKVDEDGNIVQRNPFRSMLEEYPFDLDIMGHEAEITKHRNDWKEQKNGEGYLSRLVDLLGHDPSATLNSARQQLEKEFEQHLDEAHKRKGTTWRKAYGGALKSLPSVDAAMNNLSNSSFRRGGTVRRALMIAKGSKKK